MKISVTYDFDSEEEYKDFMAKSAEALLANQSKGILEKPISMEQLEKAAEAVEDKADSSEDKPKKAKATKSTPKEEKPAPEAPEIKEDALREAFYAAMKAGKKDEVKAILAEYGVGRVSEIPKDKRAEAIEKANALM